MSSIKAEKKENNSEVSYFVQIQVLYYSIITLREKKTFFVNNSIMGKGGFIPSLIGKWKFQDLRKT